MRGSCATAAVTAALMVARCNNPRIRIQIEKFSYTWTPPVIRYPPSPMLLPVRHSAGNEGRRLPKPCVAVEERCRVLGRR